jgi:hypothetical protein
MRRISASGRVPVPSSSEAEPFHPGAQAATAPFRSPQFPPPYSELLVQYPCKPSRYIQDGNIYVPYIRLVWSLTDCPWTLIPLPYLAMTLPTHFTLNTGAQIPALGFGTWQAKPGEVERAVETALRAGYRHIDCAAIYRNEAEVGHGIRESGVPRSDIFLTGKLWNTKHAPEDVEGALDQSLRDLGVEYLDLFLMHWPVYVHHPYFPAHNFTY